MTNTTVVHHAGRRTAVDLVVGEVDGVGKHDIGDARRHPPPGRRGAHCDQSSATAQKENTLKSWKADCRV
jgi:hypothetical protein